MRANPARPRSKEPRNISHPSSRGCMRDYRKLDVWHKAHALAVLAYKATMRMPRAHGSLASQMRRSVSSVPTNISEGCGHDGSRQLAKYLGDSCASSNEFEYQILLARDVGVMTPALHAELNGRIQEVRRMLVSLRRTIRREAEREK